MKGKKTTRQTDATRTLIRALLLDLTKTGNPEAIHCLAQFDKGELPLIELIPQNFQDASSFGVALQAVSLLKKFRASGLVTTQSSSARATRAKEEFLASELLCEYANLRLGHYFNSGAQVWDEEYGAILNRARLFISRVLGDFSWDEALPFCGFGPGASVGVKRRQGHAINKIGHERPTVTRACLPLVLAYRQYGLSVFSLSEIPSEGISSASLLNNVEVVSGGRWTTVPKDVSKDRSICIEPLWNVFFQKGIGGWIRSKVRRIGLDWDHSADLNKAAARKGSIDGSLATIDLSAASDTISLALCEYLLPESLYRAVITTRSSTVDLAGRELALHKVSSMGNGFTWELEGLLFLALSWACLPPDQRRIGVDVMTFGDDIVVPGAHAQAVVRTLSFCGFKINRAKSYLSGPYRESCGGDFFDGHDVTPVRVREYLTTVTSRFWFHNQLRRRWDRWVSTRLCTTALYQGAIEATVESIPRKLRLRIPDGIGDSGLIASWDEVAPGTVRRHPNWVEGYRFRSLIEVTIRPTSYDGHAALWAVLWARFKSSVADLEFVRYDGGRKALVIRWQTSRQWPSIAPVSPG